jgi:hypothetical protein
VAVRRATDAEKLLRRTLEQNIEGSTVLVDSWLDICRDHLRWSLSDILAAFPLDWEDDAEAPPSGLAPVYRDLQQLSEHADKHGRDEAFVAADLGEKNLEHGLAFRRSGGDGKHVSCRTGPPDDQRESRVNREGSHYMYFRVTNRFVKRARSLWIRGTFYDDPAFKERVALQFSRKPAGGGMGTVQAFSRHLETVSLSGSGKWVRYTWYLDEAYFRDLQHGSADFRLLRGTAQVCVDRVEVGILYPELNSLRQHVEALFREHLVLPPVVAALEADPALDAKQKATALRIARERGDPSAMDLNNASWALLGRSGRSESDLDYALRMAELACQRVPESTNFRNTLGIAQYLNGKYREALQTLTRIDAIHERSEYPYSPALDPVYISMCYARLGEGGKAREFLEKARHLAGPDPGADMRALLRKAEALIEAR